MSHPNLLDLPHASEDEILQLFLSRFQQNLTFTYLSRNLISLNPNQPLEQNYNNEKIVFFRKNMNDFSLLANNPHIYGVTAKAFGNAVLRKRSQAIIINGEAGSGKTENAKYAMKFLVAMRSEIGSKL